MNMKNAKWRLACQIYFFAFPLKIMARPFRWPLHKQDLLLATEVASRQAIKQSGFEPIASVLSLEFGKLAYTREA